MAGDGSVASLRQRLGCSGRVPGADRVGQLYSTDEAELLQVVAVVQLLRQGWVEPPDGDGPRHDVVWHQALSSAVERGYLDEAAAGALPAEPLAHMLAEGHLVARGGRYEPGAVGLTLARRRDFCAVFAASEDYEVAAGPRVLGRLPPLAV